MVKTIQAFQTADGRIFETAAKAKRYEAEVVLGDLFCDPKNGFDLSDKDPIAGTIAFILDHADVIAPVLEAMARNDIRPPVARIEEKP